MHAKFGTLVRSFGHDQIGTEGHYLTHKQYDIMKNQSSIVALIIVLGAIISVAIGAGSIRHRNDGPRTISVKGMASRDFTSDLAVWSIKVKVHSQDPQSGFRTLSSHRQEVVSFLKQYGFDDSQIESQNVTYYEVENSYWNEAAGRTIYQKDGYMVSQEITITSTEVTKVEKTSKEIGNLIEKGITVESNAPAYHYTKLSDLKKEMLGAAAEDARARAKQIAHESKSGLGQLRKANMGVFQILGKYTDEDYSWGGTYNTTSIEKTATITVSSEFLLK